MIQGSNDTPSTPTQRAEGAIFKGFNSEVKFPVPESKLKTSNKYIFQLEQFSDKLVYRHRFPLLHHGFVVKT
jgi:hypothetical protein